ncbi:MAG: leucine-rich repeat domain-containing protein [Lachnospiraceae bacterium]|nr:leucine-rich repeat domain-containing protein [Lachnospiraceae bacterium]
MKKIIRKVIAALLCVTALILIVLPSPESYASTVRGDFEMDGSVIVKYLGNAEHVTLPNTVTEIGKDAFTGCISLVSVTIPDSVKKIGYSAFENCINLESVSLPSGIKAIDSSAFSGCGRLKTVNIPAKTKSLGSGVFAGCNSLSSVAISPDNLDYVCSDGVIYTKDGKMLVQYLAGRPHTSFTMPSNVEKIGEYAFWGANNLTDISISPKVKTIPEYAFANCAGLTNVVLPNGVESLMAFSFADCNSLRNMVIPYSVGYIDVNAFASSKSVALDFEGGAVQSAEVMPPAPSVSDNTVSGNVLEREDDGTAVYHGDEALLDRGPTTTAGPYPSNADYGYTKIVGGNALVMLSRNAPVKGLTPEAAETEDDVSESDADSIPIPPKGDYELINGIYSDYRGSDSVVEVPEGTSRIGNRAFYKNDLITDVSLPNTVATIGDFAFAKTNLTSFAIPESVTDIGYAAFYQCQDLSELSIPESVHSIDSGAFDGTAWLESWRTDPNRGNYLVVGDGILLAYKGDGGNITIPEGIKTVGAQCFFGNTSITGVSLPSSLVKIGEDAFNGCKKLKTVNLPENLSIIEDRAFMNTGLSEVIIPISVAAIGIGAFDNTGTSPMRDVVFLGNTIPASVSKSTASRLSALELRTPAFYGVDNAIVSENADVYRSGSVLSPDSLGFRGQVYKITDPSTDPGFLELETVLSEPDANGVITIDPHVDAGTRSYVMNAVSDHAFDAYSEQYYYNGVPAWLGKPVTDIRIAGNGSDALKTLLAAVPKSTAPVETTDQNAIRVICDSELFPSAQAASAVIPGNQETLVLSVNSDDYYQNIFEDAIRQEYGVYAESIVPFKISLRTMAGNIPITKLGTGKLEICLPVPEALNGRTNLKAAALNDNNVYEPLAVSEIMVDNIPCVRFVASHLSPFALFYVERQEAPAAPEEEGLSGLSILNVTNVDLLSGNTVTTGVLQTLHKQVAGGLEVKWFVIVILLCLAGILFLYKDKNKVKGKSHEK